MRCGSARKIEHYFVDVTPAPPFRRIIGFDDRVFCRVKMFCSVSIWRLIATTDMATAAADPQMQPGVTQFFRHSSHPRALGTTSRIAERCLHNIAMFSCRAPLDSACIAAPPRRMRRALLGLASAPIATITLGRRSDQAVSSESTARITVFSTLPSTLCSRGMTGS
jgi:hypothetical protein